MVLPALEIHAHGIDQHALLCPASFTQQDVLNLIPIPVYINSLFLFFFLSDRSLCDHVTRVLSTCLLMVIQIVSHREIFE